MTLHLLQQLAILRQLVEWQLAYSNRIKDMIDLAWGVKAAKHQKKADKDANAPPAPEHPESKESLRLDPYGQDVNRKRFWVLDGVSFTRKRLYGAGLSLLSLMFIRFSPDISVREPLESFMCLRRHF